MALYAISDLHLSFTTDKPMGIFGDNWVNHEEKIKANWMKKITNEDTILIGGDISWSMRADDSKEDLNWINNLPGNKIIIKGNHDYWWSSITKLNNLYENMSFIQNNFFSYKEWAICGTRGWLCPGSDKFTEKDNKIYKRELIRLRLSLEEAKKAGYEKIVCMIHYPPINEALIPTGFMELFNEFQVEKVIYGHLHGPSLARAFEGIHDDVEYIMTSCDFINFDPVKILD